MKNENEFLCKDGSGAKTVDYASEQEPTSAERRVLETLVRALKFAGISCDIGSQEFVAVPMNLRNSSEAVKKQLANVKKRFRWSKAVIRRPDISIQKHGVIIEIDGDVHDFCKKAIDSDLTRDAEYESLGCKLFAIRNEQVWDSEQLGRIIEQIKNYMLEEAATPGFQKRHAKRRKAFSRSRAYFKKLNPSADVGTYTHKRKGKTCFTGDKWTTQWLGQRISLRAQRMQSDD